MSLLGLHRRLRGAAVGHLAAFEATSSLPSPQVSSRACERLGLSPAMTAYFDEHVEADAVHEQVAAARDLWRLRVRATRTSRGRALRAACLLYLDGLFGADLLARWESAVESTTGFAS